MQVELSEDPPVSCRRCARELGPGSGFTLGGSVMCARCTFRFWPMLRRSILTALVVGTILVAINQGTEIFGGDLSASLYWKVPLTYLVPFCVATWGALINARRGG